MESNNLQLLNRLIKLGMNEREAKVYLALIYRKSATASELHIPSGVPRTKIYEILKNLIQKGYCKERKSGNIRTFEVISPKSALAHLVHELKLRIEDAGDLIEELESIVSQSSEEIEPIEYVEIIRGNENTHRKYLDLLKTVKTEILAFVRPPFSFITKAMQDEQIEVFYDIHDKGIDSRGVYEVHEDSPPLMYLSVHGGHKIGEKLRITPSLPLKMFIFDRQILLITEKKSLVSGDHMVNTIIKQESTVDGYITLFDFFWEQGLEYDQWIKGREKLMEQKLAELETI